MEGFIHFSPTGDLKSLEHLLNRLSFEKERGDIVDNIDFQALATQEMLDWFDPLTSDEQGELLVINDGLTLEQVILFGLVPGRSFRSMVSNIFDADYKLDTNLRDLERGLVSFQIIGAPYGGDYGLLGLLECTGNTPVGHDDGTGYQRYSRSWINQWKEVLG